MRRCPQRMDARVPLPLDGRADHREYPGDLLAKEDKSHDRDDRDQRQDERVFGEALAYLVTPHQRLDHRKVLAVWLAREGPGSLAITTAQDGLKAMAIPALSRLFSPGWHGHDEWE